MSGKLVLVILALALVGAAVIVAVTSLSFSPTEPPQGTAPAAPDGEAEPDVAMPPALPAERPGGGVVAGKVVGPDGEPRPGARVALTVALLEGAERHGTFRVNLGSGGMSASVSIDSGARAGPAGEAVTGPDGHFLIRVDREGPFTAAATLAGFGRAMETGVKRGTRDLVLHLSPAGILTGVVTDRTGAPVSAAVVSCAGEEVLTDVEGAFRLGDVAVGGRKVTARANGYRDATAEVTVVRDETVALAGPLVLEELPGLTGRVFDPRGEPLADAAAHLRRSFMERDFSSTDKGGRYHFDAPQSGRFTLTIRHSEYLPEQIGEIRYEKGTRQVVRDVRLRPGGEIVGRVLDPEGKPLAGVRVAATPTGKEIDFEAIMVLGMGMGEGPPTTDAEGKFRLAGLTAGTYTFTANADGYCPFLKKDVDVRVPEKTVVEARLDAGDTVRGRVVGPDGAPVAGVTVTASLLMTPGNLDEMMTADWNSTGKTGEDGAFEIRGIWKKVELYATADGMAPDTEETIQADPGADDVLIKMIRTATVSGRVVADESGEPVVTAEVVVGPISSVTGDDGTFTVAGLRPGKHEVTVRAQGFAPPEASPVEIEAGETVSGLEIRLGRGESVVGEVRRTADGSLVEGAELSFSGPVDQKTETDGQGRFEMSGLLPGTYQVEVSADSLATKTVEEVVVPRSGDLAISLDAGATIRGIVRDKEGNPVAGRMVLRGQGSDFGSDMQMTDSEGRFTFANVPAGEHTLVLMAMQGGGSGMGIDMNSQTVEVAEGEEAFVEFGGRDQKRKAVVRGRLLSRGTPVKGKMIILFPTEFDGGAAGMMAGFKMVSTDEEGRFNLEDVQPGKYRLLVGDAGGGGVGANTELTVGEGGVIEKDIELPPGTFAGRILNAKGEPVVGADARLLDASLASRPVTSLGEVLDMFKGQGRANEKGEFLIENVEPGRYLLQVVADGYAPLLIDDVEVSEQAGSPLELKLTEGTKVTVKVTGADGAPLPEAKVILFDAGGRWILAEQNMTASTGADGALELNLGPGRWGIRVQADGYASTERTFRVPTDTKVAVALTSGGGIRLSVRDGAKPVADALIRVFGADGREIAPWMTQETLMTGAAGRRTAADGTVTLANLPAGAVRVVAVAPDGRTGEIALHVQEGATLDAEITLR